MTKAETFTAPADDALVDISLDQIQISDIRRRVVVLNGQQIWPVLATAVAVQAAIALPALDIGGLAVLNEIIRKLALKPGDANPSAKLLPAETGLGGLVLAGLMKDNGDALVTMPHNLPVRVNWNTLAGHATEADIQNQFINVHHLFKARCTHDYGFQDWRAPNMKCEDNYRADESKMLWKFSNAGGRKLFDKSGAWPASAFWAARRHSDTEACYVWADNSSQHRYQPTYGDSSTRTELPVRPVRRFALCSTRSIPPVP